jgi:hypothetical protein
MLEELLHEKTVQVSIVSGVLFFILGNENVLKMVSNGVKKLLKIKLEGQLLLLFHSLLFTVLVGLLTYHIFNPLFAWAHREGFSGTCSGGSAPTLQGDGSTQCMCPSGTTLELEPDGTVMQPATCVASEVPSTPPVTQAHPTNTQHPVCAPYDPNDPSNTGNAACHSDEYCDLGMCKKNPPDVVGDQP